MSVKNNASTALLGLAIAAAFAVAAKLMGTDHAVKVAAGAGIAWGALCLVRGRGGTRYAMGPALLLVGLWVLVSASLPPAPGAPAHRAPAQPAAVVGVAR